MKRRIFLVWLGLGMWIGLSWAGDEYRVFTDTQGHAIQGKVTACDLARNKVTVERQQDHQRVTVPIRIFSKSDQAYIREWYMGHELISERNLKITCKEKRLKKWKKDESTAINGNAGGYLGDRVDSKKYEKIAYEVTFHNSGDMPLKNIRMEYKIYYEQSQKGANPEPQQKVFKKSMKMASLGKGKSVTVDTGSVDIYDEEISQPSSVVSTYTPAGGKGRVHGLRARLYIVLPSGKEAMREFCEPSSLSEERFPW